MRTTYIQNGNERKINSCLPIMNEAPPPVKDQAAGDNLWASFATDPQNWWFPLVLPHQFPPWSFKSKFTGDKWNTRSSWLLAPESSFVWLSLDDQGLGAANARQITALAFRSMSKKHQYSGSTQAPGMPSVHTRVRELKDTVVQTPFRCAPPELLGLAYVHRRLRSPLGSPALAGQKELLRSESTWLAGDKEGLM